MARSRKETKKANSGPCVVVVGGTDQLVEACRRVAAGLASARVEPCEVVNVATKAAEYRPFAMVVTENVYEFDPLEFEALARDVGAELLTVSGGSASVGRLERELLLPLEEAFKEGRR